MEEQNVLQKINKSLAVTTHDLDKVDLAVCTEYNVWVASEPIVVVGVL